MVTTSEEIELGDDEFADEILFSIAPLTSAEEFRSIPGIDVATTFAESLNMQCFNRLRPILDEDVLYTSTWTNTQLNGWWNVLNWFARRS